MGHVVEKAHKRIIDEKLQMYTAPTVRHQAVRTQDTGVV